MAVIYVDTSATVKRLFPEEDSQRLKAAFVNAGQRGDQLVASALTRIELSRTILRRRSSLVVAGDQAYREAMQGIAVAPMTDVVVELARAIDPPLLRSLDAIHLATAVAVGADELWTYDDRLADAATTAGIAVRSPQ